MIYQDLTGEWQVGAEGERGSFAATVPGCIHTDLLAAGRIEDPFWRTNEENVQWVGETVWAFEREFEVAGNLLSHDRIVLRCEGLDTLATVWVNGTKCAVTDNMFRTWDIEVADVLKEGLNKIRVRFDSPWPYICARQEKRVLHGAFTPEASWLRKMPCNFGWDWGPRLVTCGIWRGMGLVAWNTARLSDVRVAQEHDGQDVVDLKVHVAAEVLAQPRLRARCVVRFGGEVLDERTEPLKRRRAVVHLPVLKPYLWWPNGMGEQPLYEVEVTLLDTDDNVLDCWARRVGLRTLRLVREKDAHGESFRFEVNGEAFFARGANWIPADTFVTRLGRDDYAQLLGSAVAANMNMVRVWGGGIYEQDVFYDLCDELGLCVWQDFMFACGTYPSFDPDFMSNAEAEAQDNVRRLRHHACLALWCGNNEIEQGLVDDDWDEKRMSWADYKRLFDDLLAGVVRQVDPGRSYWPCSPHTPRGDRLEWNDPRSGDAHLWSVWHGGKPFSWYLGSRHRFVSEFGFQSFPAPRTVESFTVPTDRNISSRVMEHHQRCDGGNRRILTQMLDHLRQPSGFEMTVHASQILQGLAIQTAVEHWRRNRDRTMGALYWQLNDCWPVASWSSIDSFGRWKALHYFARRFYAPLLVSGVVDHERCAVDVHVSNERREDFRGRLAWVVTDLSGETLQDKSRGVGVDAYCSELVRTLDFSKIAEKRGRLSLLVWLELRDRAGMCVSRNLVTFGPPKHLELADPELRAEVRRGEEPDTLAVRVSGKHPALWAWIEMEGMDAEFSDNFFHVRPGKDVEVLVRPDEALSVKEARGRLLVRSLRDTSMECGER